MEREERQRAAEEAKLAASAAAAGTGAGFGCDRDLIGAVVDQRQRRGEFGRHESPAFPAPSNRPILVAISCKSLRLAKRSRLRPRANANSSCLGSQYPPELMRGFDTPIVRGEVSSVAVASGRKLGGGGRKGNQKNARSSADAVAAPPAEKVYTYEMLRNMEIRRPGVNQRTYLPCEHGSIKQCSTKSSRARCRVLDKQPWRVLKRLYPESVPLDTDGAGCLLCVAEAETVKRAESDRKEEEKADRKKPLGCPLVWGFYTRGSPRIPPNGGPGARAGERPVPLPLDDSSCPLTPGGGPIPAPDASEVLCDAHNLPLVPPHLEAFLRGESGTLLGGNSGTAGGNSDEGSAPVPVDAAAAAPVGSRCPAPRVGPDCAEMLRALRAAGLSESELRAQRAAMAWMEEGLRRVSIRERERPQPSHQPAVTNEQLDRENRIVVEVLTDEEVGAWAWEKWWPQHCTYTLRFVIVEGGARGSTVILWSTSPCRECDPSSRSSALW
ncbi:hypothetical protein ACHAWF_003374 [Thalassiosira exigua]